MDYYTKQMMSLRHKIRMYLTMFSLGEKKGGGGGGEGEHTVFAICVTALNLSHRQTVGLWGRNPLMQHPD